MRFLMRGFDAKTKPLHEEKVASMRGFVGGTRALCFCGSGVGPLDRSPCTVCMFLIVQAEPVHAVVVLWVSHDRVDVIGLLNGEFDNQARSMEAVIEGAANVVCRAAPGKVQLIQ